MKLLLMDWFHSVYGGGGVSSVDRARGMWHCGWVRIPVKTTYIWLCCNLFPRCVSASSNASSSHTMPIWYGRLKIHWVCKSSFSGWPPSQVIHYITTMIKLKYCCYGVKQTILYWFIGGFFTLSPAQAIFMMIIVLLLFKYHLHRMQKHTINLCH